MRNARIKAAAVASLAYALGACATAPTGLAVLSEPVIPDARFSTLRGELAGMTQSGELVSLAVGVIDNGEVVWAESWGYADREAGGKAALDTRYGLASLGKSLTATAIMELVEAHKVKLDDKVSRYLGKDALRDYAGAGAPTVRQLLNMTGGIPHGAVTYTSEPHPAEQQVFDNRAIVVFEPGTAFHYSNFSIAVADKVIEKAAGMAFGDYMRAHVFLPLGMTESAVGEAGLAAPAARYDSDGERYGPLAAFPRSSRQMSASLRDMLKYAAFQLKAPAPGQRGILTDASIDAMHYERSDIPGAHIALGWGSIDIGGGQRWLISSGNDMGVQSSLTLLPEAGVGVIVLTNSSGYQADEIGVRAADILAPGFLKRAGAAIAAHESNTAPFAPAPEWTGEWDGVVLTNEGEAPVIMTFLESGDVMISHAGAAPQKLEEATMSAGLLTGVFKGELPLEEAAEGPHRIEIGLKRQGDEMKGFALSNFRNSRGKFEIPTYFHLQRNTAPGD